MRKTRLLILTGAVLCILSCSKADMVKGKYTGTATGTYVGTNEPANVRLTSSGESTVHVVAGYNGGLSMDYGYLSITETSDKHYTISSDYVQITIDNSSMDLVYNNPTPAPGFPSHIEFTGTKETN